MKSRTKYYGFEKKVAKTEELYSDKNIKITRTGGNIIIDNLTDKEINIESTIVINNSIEATPFSSSQSSIDPKGKQSVSISEFVAVNPGQKVEESDEKAKKANYYKHKMKSGENIGWTANIQNGNYDTMNSFSINFNTNGYTRSDTGTKVHSYLRTHPKNQGLTKSATCSIINALKKK